MPSKCNLPNCDATLHLQDLSMHGVPGNVELVNILQLISVFALLLVYLMVLTDVLYDKGD